MKSKKDKKSFADTSTLGWVCILYFLILSYAIYKHNLEDISVLCTLRSTSLCFGIVALTYDKLGAVIKKNTKPWDGDK